MKKILRNLLPNKLWFFLARLKNGNFNFLLNIVKVKNTKIVVSNHCGKGYGDSGKYIVEELLKRDEEFDIVWLIKDANKKTRKEFPESIRLVKYDSQRAIFELATASIWIDNTRKEIYPPKKKKQIYIQTWHSPLRLKKIEKDAESYLTDYYVKKAKKDSKMIDLFIAGNDFSYQIYRNSFWYDGRIQMLGTPRCDVLVNQSDVIRAEILETFDLEKDTKIVLYAPTFRQNNNISPYFKEYDSLVEQLHEKFGGNWVVMVKLHPNVSEDSRFIIENEHVINATNYGDIQNLIIIADFLITDYSSCMFDMLIANKPCILYLEDLNEYLEKERDLYFEIYDLPFKIATNKEELFQIINNVPYDEYLKEYVEFSTIVGINEDGKASKKVVDLLLDIKENRWKNEKI